MWPASDFSAAAAPTRNEPCSSANTRLATFVDASARLESSMIAKLTSGYSGATLPTDAA